VGPGFVVESADDQTAVVTPTEPPIDSRFSLTGFGGIRLVGDRRGEPSARPVLFLHGGGQTRYSWGGAARRIAQEGWQAVTVDARGHGESDWADGDYRLTSFAADVQTVAALSEQPPVIVGASLGGLTAILLEGELAPGTAAGIVLVDIIPDMEQAGADRIQAFMAEKATEGFDSLDEVADAIAAYNPHRPRPEDLDGLRKNLRERDGRWFWHWDPDFVGGTADFPPEELMDRDRLNAAVAAIEVPMLLVRGRMSDLVTEESAAAFRQRFPHIGFADVSGAGHMVAGDRNDVFTTAVLGYLEALPDV
jgi:pimeloyl-ACP methyl ester carboxylesterase